MATATLFCYISMSKVPVKYMLRGLKGILLFIFASVVINMLFAPGDVIWEWGIIHITFPGIRNAAYTMIRIIYLVLGASVVTYTTTPTKLTDGLEKGFHFLKEFKLPVHEISMMVSVALRFIPILVEELDRIRKAQLARCADFESRNLIKRMKSLYPLIIPLFVSAIRRANDLASAMEARCYRGGEGRTKLHPLVYRKEDKIAYVILWVYFIAMLTVKIALSETIIDQLRNW